MSNITNKPDKVAEEILRKYYLSDPSEVELPDLLGCEGILYKTSELNSSQGSMVRFGRGGIINVNRSIQNLHKIRYVTVHELGHWFMHRDSGLFSCNEEDLNEWNSSTDSLEREANQFASAFLMPKIPFIDFTSGLAVSRDLFVELHHRFNVSITAASIRYCSIGEKPLILVYSEQGKISWYSRSDKFAYNFYGRVKGQTVPSNSLTGKYFAGKNGEKVCLAKIWFPLDRSIRSDSYLEEVLMPLPKYNACITYLLDHNPLN